MDLALARARALAFQAQLEAAGKSDDLSTKVQLPTLYPKQIEIYEQRKRFNVLDIGRRAGKTYLGKYIAGRTALAGKRVGWFAPNYKYLLEVWGVLDELLSPVATKINATERRIELPNGGLIECWSLDGTEDAGKSRAYHVAIVDEAAIAPSLKNTWQQAIRPTLTDYQGDAWFLSTPKGLNFFYELFGYGQDPLKPDWISWELPSSVNPYLPPAEIIAAESELPELVFQQEYLAKFIQDSGAVFRNLDAVLAAPPTQPSAHRGHVVVAGVDLAQKHDFTAVSIYCCTCNRELFLDRWNQLGWEFQRVRLVNLLIKWGVEYALIELNSIGSPNFEALLDIVPDHVALVGFTTTSKTKPKLIQQAALACEKEDCCFLDDPIGKFEMLAFECEITGTGYPKYGAPEGGYDDTVIARCLTLEAKHRNPAPEISKAERQDLQLPRPLREDAVAERLKAIAQGDEWRVTAPRNLALAAIEKKEQQQREERNPFGIFDRL